MWFRTRTEAILAALRAIDRKVDPEQLDRQARDLGIKLPVTVASVCAPSLGRTQTTGWQVAIDDMAAFRVAVDTILAGGKRAA